MLNNKKGAALLQVLLVTVVLAGMATMLLRASLSRTTTARQTRRTVSAQLLVNACMAEVNTLWSNKTPAAFANDMKQCIMYCKSGSNPTAICTSSNSVTEYTCQKITLEGVDYTVTAKMTGTQDANGQCRLDYHINDNGSGTSVEL
ncbi:MAG: hypothetical protein PUK24_06290 [Elusimicrobia bacterium]|nr:hypothetical protein [Elusimicrobiota bacterium]MDY6039770.1 hypothetical protein [Elusimicrobiaceae bacterium]